MLFPSPLEPFWVTMMSCEGSLICSIILHCTKTKKNEGGISQWRLLIIQKLKSIQFIVHTIKCPCKDWWDSSPFFVFKLYLLPPLSNNNNKNYQHNIHIHWYTPYPSLPNIYNFPTLGPRQTAQPLTPYSPHWTQSYTRSAIFSCTTSMPCMGELDCYNQLPSHLAKPKQIRMEISCLIALSAN